MRLLFFTHLFTLSGDTFQKTVAVIASNTGVEEGLEDIYFVHAIFDMLHPIGLCYCAGSLLPASVFGTRIWSQGETEAAE